MKAGIEGALRRNAVWVALPVVATAAFFFGGWLLGGEERATIDHDHRGSEESGIKTWTCVMHPHIRTKERGSCPICGMDLIPVDDGTEEIDMDTTTVRLSERAKVLARIRTAEVGRLGSGRVERRLLGRVDYDETTLRTVTAWVGGRIERLHVGTTGERVKRGQVIASLYSPEVYSAHQDLIQSRQQLERLRQRATPSARDAAQAALQAARDRLRLLGVPDRELATMERSERPSERVPIRTPFGGTVIERLATQGNYVKTGSGLYRVADLSRLWVQLDAYESDLPVLRKGQDVALRVKALPGQTFEGHVTFVDPVLDPETRTARVRVEVRNEERRLRPGMFVEANVKTVAEDADEQPLVVPATAPLFTGRRSLAYVEVPDAEAPTYEARVVELGPKMGDFYPVVSGLQEGERVVIHGAFAIDADLQIRGGRSMMALPDESGQAGTPAKGHPH